MTCNLKVHKKEFKDGRVTQALYRFSTPNNTYTISIANHRTQTNKRIYYVQFDITRRLEAAFGSEAPQSVGEGTPFTIFATVAKAVETFFNQHYIDIESIVLRGNSSLYAYLTDRYTTENNAACAAVIRYR